MRVLLDATPMPAERVGVGHYLMGLLGALVRRGEDDIHVLARARDAALMRAIGATVHEASPGTRPSRLVWAETVLPLRVRLLGPDVFHGPHYTLPRATGCPSVVTFHDPTFFTHPELHERAKVHYFTRAARLGAKRAARIIAVSEYAKRGAVEYAGADPGKVDVAYLGVDSPPAPDPSLDDRLRARVGAVRPYLFWVGAIEPRKDVPSLVQAFAGLPRDLRLVLAGGRAWGADALDEAVRRSGVADRILRPGYVSDEEKVALYRGAEALVYPSIAEGFGLPVLEAMALGCPVVTTTGSAPEEVAGAAAALVPPRDPTALREAIVSVLEDPERFRRAGLERAKRFGWDRTAEATVSAYRRAAGSHPPSDPGART